MGELAQCLAAQIGCQPSNIVKTFFLQKSAAPALKAKISSG
jgi:hypothetical protein